MTRKVGFVAADSGVMSRTRRLLGRLGSVLPRGVTLPIESWEPRHRWIVRLLWLHVPALVLYSVVRGDGVAHGVVEVIPLIVMALAATRGGFGQRVSSCLAALGLMTASAMLVHLGDGQIELHFHFFVMLPVISLYHDWRPFLLSIGFVAAHHGTVGVLSPHDVYNHDAAWQAPLQWAGIHAVFVLAASAVCVLSWRLIEDSNRAARHELESNERRFRALVEQANDVVSVVDARGTILYDSPAIARVLGYLPHERLGTAYGETIHHEDRERVAEAVARALRDDGIVKQLELRVRHRDGSYRWIEATVTNLLDDPAVGGLVGNFRDITERRELESQLAHQAFHDSLTGLANRALLLDRIEHGLERRGDRGEGRLGLLFLDVDDFKTVNDGLGHAAGDDILRVTAERIASVLRPGDTASRLGGDEFAVLLERIPDAAVAYEVGARLLEAVCLPIEVEGGFIAVHASLGIAVSEGTEDAAALLRNADLAMYRAKGAGKARFEIYEAGMHAAVVERMALKADLRRGVETGEFEPYYQPIVDLASGEVTGMEALARWHHPTLGLVTPATFIPLAEETGLIVAIGRHVLRAACADAMRWQEQLGDRAPRSISVNLSPRQIQHADLVADVRAALTESGLPAHHLTLEITEGVLLEETGAVAVTLAALKQLGVRIALDDFGTGYSSLSYLEQFPVDVVKIDKSFIDSLGNVASPPSPLVSAIVNLGAVLGLDITAEGIEDTAQLDRLRTMGCAHGQGYLFAKPMPAAQIVELLRQRQTATAVADISNSVGSGLASPLHVIGEKLPAE